MPDYPKRNNLLKEAIQLGLNRKNIDLYVSSFKPSLSVENIKKLMAPENRLACFDKAKFSYMAFNPSRAIRGREANIMMVDDINGNWVDVKNSTNKFFGCDTSTKVDYSAVYPNRTEEMLKDESIQELINLTAKLKRERKDRTRQLVDRWILNAITQFGYRTMQEAKACGINAYVFPRTPIRRRSINLSLWQLQVNQDGVSLASALLTEEDAKNSGLFPKSLEWPYQPAGQVRSLNPHQAKFIRELKGDWIIPVSVGS